MIYILLLFVLFLVGIPICFSLGLVSLGGIVAGGYPLTVVIQRLFTGADSTALIAIPLFILAGGLMVQGGISKRIVDFADALIGHLPSAGPGQHPGLYVLRRDYWLRHRGHRGNRRHHDPHHGEEGL